MGKSGRLFEIINLNIIFPHAEKHYVTMDFARVRRTVHNGFGRGKVAEDSRSLSNISR
jgi:hypothetical protein